MASRFRKSGIGDIKKITILVGISILFLSFACIKMFVCEIAIIAGDSMYPTLKNGEVCVVRHWNYAPGRSDVVLINSAIGSGNNEYIVKRIIAFGGETVHIDYKNNQVEVNGTVLFEKYVNVECIDPLLEQEGMLGTVFYVPIGHVFVMGDNRNTSLDSRSKEVGFVPESDIIGKVVFHSPFLDR